MSWILEFLQFWVYIVVKTLCYLFNPYIEFIYKWVLIAVVNDDVIYLGYPQGLSRYTVYDLVFLRKYL